jgi:hypothetical protein
MDQATTTSWAFQLTSFVGLRRRPAPHRRNQLAIFLHPVALPPCCPTSAPIWWRPPAGEFSALVAAKVQGFEDALVPSAILIPPADTTRVCICQELYSGHVVVAHNYNRPGQLAGIRFAAAILRLAQNRLKAAGAKRAPAAACGGGAFHSPPDAVRRKLARYCPDHPSAGDQPGMTRTDAASR